MILFCFLVVSSAHRIIFSVLSFFKDNLRRVTVRHKCGLYVSFDCQLTPDERNLRYVPERTDQEVCHLLTSSPSCYHRPQTWNIERVFSAIFYIFYFYFFDKRIIDGITNGVGFTSFLLGEGIKYVGVGRVSSYLLLYLFNVLIFLLLYLVIYYFV